MSEIVDIDSKIESVSGQVMIIIDDCLDGPSRPLNPCDQKVLNDAFLLLESAEQGHQTITERAKLTEDSPDQTHMFTEVLTAIKLTSKVSTVRGVLRKIRESKAVINGILQGQLGIPIPNSKQRICRQTVRLFGALNRYRSISSNMTSYK